MADKAAWRFIGFVVGSVGLPALVFLVSRPYHAAEAQPAMLALLLSPVTFGWLTTRGFARSPPSARPTTTLRAVGLALAVMGMLIMGSIAAAFAAGAMVLAGPAILGRGVAGAVMGMATSTLEELGWAAGGTALARGVAGPRLGIAVLGLVWAAWHLVVAGFAPPETVVGMFGTEHPFVPGRLISFVLAFVAFRFLLTTLRDRADNVWPAVAGHAFGNVLLGALLGSGWAKLVPDGPWVFFPGPAGSRFSPGSRLPSSDFGGVGDETLARGGGVDRVGRVRGRGRRRTDQAGRQG